MKRNVNVANFLNGYIRFSFRFFTLFSLLSAILTTSLFILVGFDSFKDSSSYLKTNVEHQRVEHFTICYSKNEMHSIFAIQVKLITSCRMILMIDFYLIELRFVNWISLSLFLCLGLFIFVGLSVSLFLSFSVCVSLYLSVCLSVSVSLSLSLSLSLFLSQLLLMWILYSKFKQVNLSRRAFVEVHTGIWRLFIVVDSLNLN